MGITRYKNIAAMQKTGKQRTGKATGGRVKKQVGGRGPVRGPNVKLTPRQQMDATIRPQMARMRREMQASRPPGPTAPMQRTGISPAQRAPARDEAASRQREEDAYAAAQAASKEKPRPGGRTGGRVKKRRGGEPQFQKGKVGRQRQAAYYSHVAPKAAKKQLRKKPPGRAATQGIGMKKGGRVSKAKGGKSKR